MYLIYSRKRWHVDFIQIASCILYYIFWGVRHFCSPFHIYVYIYTYIYILKLINIVTYCSFIFIAKYTQWLTDLFFCWWIVGLAPLLFIINNAAMNIYVHVMYCKWGGFLKKIFTFLQLWLVNGWKGCEYWF